MVANLKEGLKMPDQVIQAAEAAGADVLAQMQKRAEQAEASVRYYADRLAGAERRLGRHRLWLGLVGLGVLVVAALAAIGTL